MKKLISLLLLALALTFAGCGAPAQTPAEPAPAAAEEPAAESVEAVPAQEHYAFRRGADRRAHRSSTL